MSVDKMSASVRAHIVSRLKEVLTRGTGEAITERKLKSFQEYTSREQIRSDTDTVGGRHESIMSRGAFESLLKDMSEAIKEKELSDQLSLAVTAATFEGFIAYISEIYYKDKEFLLTDNRRVKNGFIYSGPTRNTTQSVAVFAKAENREEAAKDVLLLKNIPQGKLVTYYTEYIAANTPGITEDVKKQLKKSLQGGHLTGVFTARLIRAFNLQKDPQGQVKFRTNTQRQLSEFEKQLGIIVDLVTDADFLSSNIALDLDLFTQTDKRLYSNAAEVRLTTEVQFAKTNQAAGDLLTTAGTYLSRLISSIKPNVSDAAQEKAAQEAFAKMLQNLEKVSLYVKDRAQQLKKLDSTQKLDPKVRTKLEKVLINQQTFETLLRTKGSDSMLDHIKNLVKAPLTGKAASRSRSLVTTKDKIKIGKPSVSTKPATKPKTKLIQREFVSPSLKLGLSAEQSITSLQRILDLSLAEKIKQNMGEGDRRDILNLRSGRFADSVKVERISESRQGLLTAFYTYMKNPYATFSAGGKQQYPKTRDPKLLISRSIRELLQAQVGNRLRAVSL